MAQLSDPIKLAITQALACYDTPTQVADFVKEEFGIVITRQQASQYDASRTTGKTMSKKLRAIFESTRAEFLKSTAEIPIAQQSYRLRVLQRQLQKAEKLGNMAMISQLLEQAAKEAGGAFTNRREITGKGGGPIAQQHSAISPEELAAAVRTVREEF